MGLRGIDVLDGIKWDGCGRRGLRGSGGHVVYVILIWGTTGRFTSEWR